MKVSPRYPLTLFFSFAWLLFVLVVYYWIYKPITPPVARALGGAVLDLCAAFVMVAVSGGMGRFSLEKLLPDWVVILSRSERLAGEALLGLGMLSVLIFLVGLINLSMVSMVGLLLLLAMLTRRGLLGWLADLWAWRKFKLDFPWSKGLVFFISFSAALGLIMSVAPPTKFDSLTYQLVGAKLWYTEGHFYSISGNHFFAFPQLINTLYSGQLALLGGRLTGASPLHALMGLLALLGLGGYATRRFKPQIGLMAAAILIATPSLWLQFGWAYADLATTAYGIMTFIMLDQWRHSKQDSWLIVAGVFAGFAMATKYTALGWGIAAGGYVLVYGRYAGVSNLIRLGVLYGATAALVLAPWLIRNWFFYDNPIYPFGPLTGEWDALSREWYTAADEALLRQYPLFLLLLPITSTFLGVISAGGFDATIGPLFLMLIPFLLLTWRELDAAWRSSLQGAWVLILGTTAFWVLSASLSVYGAQTRLVFSMFPLLALLAAVSFDSLRLLPRKPLDFGWILRTLVAVILALTLFDYLTGRSPKEGQLQGTTRESHFLESHTLEFATGIISEDEYLEERLGAYVLAMRQLNTLPVGATILFLWETRSLFCDESKIICNEDTVLMRWWHDRRSIDDGSAAALIENWRNQGVTHVLVWETGRKSEFDENPKITAEDKAEWEKVPALLEPIWNWGDLYTLYKMP